MRQTGECNLTLFAGFGRKARFYEAPPGLLDSPFPSPATIVVNGSDDSSQLDLYTSVAIRVLNLVACI